jgi:hypothetical protein
VRSEGKLVGDFFLSGTGFGLTIERKRVGRK